MKTEDTWDAATISYLAIVVVHCIAFGALVLCAFGGILEDESLFTGSRGDHLVPLWLRLYVLPLSALLYALGWRACRGNPTARAVAGTMRFCAMLLFYFGLVSVTLSYDSVVR